MRSGFLFFLILLSAALCQADTIYDTFNQPQTNCNYSGTAPYSNCDVIGDPQLYDIQMANFTIGSGTLTMMIYLNSGAVQTDPNHPQQLVLGSFVDGIKLNPGDLLFYNAAAGYDPSDPTTAQYVYGVPLVDHGSLNAGSLYSVTSVLTAQDVLQDNNDYYRKNQVVWMGSGNYQSTGTIGVAATGGDGTSSARYVITLTIPMTADFQALVTSGQLGMVFSSADCGNDVIYGTMAAPEPSPALLVLTGIGLLIAGRKWRKRAA